MGRYILQMPAVGLGVEAVADRLAEFSLRLDRTYGLLSLPVDPPVVLGRVFGEPSDVERCHAETGWEFFQDFGISSERSD